MEQQAESYINDIKFAYLSPKMIKEMAKAKVVTPELYDKEGYPVDGGLMDVRLGVIDPGLRCKTDGQRIKDSLGHFGYVELARPVIHISFVALILDLLRCTCRETGELLIPKNKIKGYVDELDAIEAAQGVSERRKRVVELIHVMRATTKSPSGVKQKKITLEKPSTFLEDERRISPIEIRARLERISDDDLPLFGINPEAMRPEWAVLTMLLIPPVTMRPSITLETGERSEDDLTHKLGDIVRINQRLFENINAGAPEIIIEDLWDLLQYHITTFFNNEVPQLPPARHRSGQPLKTITARIKSKEGRIRHNLAGKRTNFSARTVISPDPAIEINEVGVPKIMAMKLTVPERVTQWNMEYLKRFVQKGAKSYPGANYIIRPDGRRKRITDEAKEALLEEIQPGFVVERHLLDGDVALFNRQPSLHRMSMMCHKVRVLPGKTLRMNPSVTIPYNADFDGDEMNLHIPQTEEARAEAEILMQVQTQIVSPRFGLSIVGCHQDAVTGNYVLSKYLTFTRQEAIDLLMIIGVEDFSRLPNKKVISGREVFSVVLPEDFNFVAEPRSKSEQDIENAVVIKNGNFEKGVLDKSQLGAGAGLLLRTLHKKYGADRMVTILGHIFKLGVNTLLKYGFTAAISDTDLSVESDERIRQLLNEAEADVHKMIMEYEQGTLELLPGRSLDETVELKILERLNKARNDTGTIAAENAVKTTGTMLMVQSGGRGNLINVAQMAACVGQQAFRGGRISTGYKGRTLSCFKKGDLGSEARGFIRNSFRSGLKPHETFFMAMTGRDSLMDTALRTPKSGYLYRRLANALQDIKVDYDGTVRDASGKIVQFQYGEDSMDVSKTEGGKFNVKNIIETMGDH
ncbi:MAG: DNA-directed RNA polymerase subunit A' [Candidatus Woesearchaeota archaeon]|nr:DNA-directed RNA polymerase subunit A' [Candidatus Woesearchaeota archaeon]